MSDFKYGLMLFVTVVIVVILASLIARCGVKEKVTSLRLDVESQCALLHAQPVGLITNDNKKIYVCDRNKNTVRIELNGKNSKVYE